MTPGDTPGEGIDHDQPRPPELTNSIDPDKPPSEAVIRAVATLTDTPPLELAPLYNAIDPDHLDEVIERSTSAGSALELAFTYAGCTVVVTPTEIRVRPSENISNST